MTPNQRQRTWKRVRKELHAQLEASSKAVSERVRVSREESESRRGDSGDFVDRYYDDSVDLALTETDDLTCLGVKRAIAHGDAGNYGICEECEEEISLKRLKAIPWATRCIDCTERAESGRSSGAHAFV